MKFRKRTKEVSCVGKVSTSHFYQGAFIDIEGVHDG